MPRYQALVAQNDLHTDAAQEQAAIKLQELHEALTHKPKFWQKQKPARGIYLWGDVGRGKSLLMDLFFNNTTLTPKRRIHFHAFMIEMHEAIADWRAMSDKDRKQQRHFDKSAPIDDPVPHIGKLAFSQAKLLCFDEFQVSDIADAFLLGRLFGNLFERGVTIVATSNRPPDDLYKDGINRDLFLPFIDLLKDQLDIVNLAANRDYRLDQLSGAPIYYFPLGSTADEAMDAAWARIITGGREQAQTLKVKGRNLTLSRTARDAARADFDQLCGQARGAEDYLAIARNFNTLLLDNIPQLSPAKRNEAKRFVTLIDALYEYKVKLVCSADASPQELYPQGDGSFEFERTVSRLMEMQSQAYLAAAHVNEMPVTKEA